MNYATLLLTNYAKNILFLIGLALSTSCSSLLHSPSTTSNQINFLIHTDNESAQTYGTDNSPWKITTHLIAKKEVPKTYFYDFTVHSLSDPFEISEIKYKYGEYGKWRLLEKEKFLTREDELHLAKLHTLYKIPITIKKIGIAHKQIFQITIKTINSDEIYLALVFGVNKCITRKTKETLCF